MPGKPRQCWSSAILAFSAWRAELVVLFDVGVGVHASDGKLPHDVGDPAGCVVQVLLQLCPILFAQLAFEDGQRSVIHIALADVP